MVWGKVCGSSSPIVVVQIRTVRARCFLFYGRYRQPQFLLFMRGLPVSSLPATVHFIPIHRPADPAGIDWEPTQDSIVAGFYHTGTDQVLFFCVSRSLGGCVFSGMHHRGHQRDKRCNASQSHRDRRRFD